MITLSKITILVAVAALTLAALPSANAQQAILFEHLTEKDGLSQGSVICTFQDSRGFMWFGTQDGLNKFDGYECKIFKHDPADPKSISDNFILSIAEDSAHTLWFGTLNNPAVLNKFDRTTETFSQIPRDSVDLRKARVSSVHPAFVDPAGVRWSGSIGQGFTRFDPRTGTTKIFRHNPADPRSLLDDRVYSVVGDQTGVIWIGTRGGLEQFDPKTELFTHFRHNDNDPRSLSADFVWPVLEDRAGVIWIGTYSGGLNRFDRATRTFTSFRHNEAELRSLANNQIYSLYQDQAGMIWVGVADHGVDRFQPEVNGFIHIFHDPKNENGIADNNILSMYVDRSGLVWIGTRSGLNRWDRKTGTFTLSKHQDSNPRSIGDDLVQVMLEDRAGNFWLGTVSNGLDKLDRATGIFTHYKNIPADNRSLSDNRIYALCEDNNGDLWVGTYGGGLCRLDHATGSFTRFVHNDSLPASLGGQGVWALLLDRRGILWVGTSGNGLDRFDRATQTFSHFTHSETNLRSLSDDIVASLCEDRSGNLWIGTTGGVNRLQPDSGSFRSYREKDGLANDVVFGILEDNAGNLWMSTNKGLSRFDPMHERFRNYNYNDGLQGNEFNQGAYAKDHATGELFFGGSNGLTVFNPADIRDNLYVPPVVFSSFTRYNSDDKQGKPILEPGIDSRTQIVLSYKDNVATFKFAALNFHNTFKNQYAYRLEGFSDNWIQLGPERTATFTNLDAGTYALHVRGSNNDGLWNDRGGALQVIVTPPWWKTRWAYGMYGFMIVAFLYSARRFEMDRKEQKAKMRESELRAKAVEAEKRALQAENERQFKELEDARKLQLSMLPKEVPQIPGYEIAVSMRTATEVGGDYYDFSVTPEGMLNVAFGDATGHGMQAGTIVTLMKGLFISDADKFELKSFFNHCSKAIKDIKLGRLYMALTMARFNGRNVALSSAGMPPAYVYRKKDGSIEEILLKSMPLGAMKNFPYTLHETTLDEGDILLFLTDGLPEQKNASEEMFDYARVIENFKRVAGCAPNEIIVHLMNEGEAWMNGIPQDDDITLLVVKRTDEQI